MGWADMLISLGMPYNSDSAIRLGEEVMAFINSEGHNASRSLAKERGPFPNFEGSVFALRGEPPIRNATVTTIAPTGTISIIANASSGIEPIFAVSFVRQVLDNNILVEVHPLFEKIMKQSGIHSETLMEKIAEHGTIQDIDEIPLDLRRIFVTAHDITPADHVRMQAAFQKNTDNAVSKTVNFPRTATVEEVREVYELSYKLDCKGVTIYRDGSREHQVLSTGKTSQEDEATGQTTVRERPMSLMGWTYRMQTGCGPLYVTINEDEGGLFELFTTMGKAGGCAASQNEAIGRMVSLAWRSGVEPDEVIKQLMDISCHSHAGFGATRILSCADAVARAIRNHVASPERTEKMEKRSLFKGACRECGGQVEHEGGCSVCHSCGFSECF